MGKAGGAAQGRGEELGLRSHTLLEEPWEFLNLSVPQFPTLSGCRN